MAARFNGNINIDIRHSESDWTPFEPPKAPEGAPNVVYIVLDDVGFSAMGCYGGGFERFYGFSGEPCVDLEREAAMMLARELRAAGWFWPRTGRDSRRVSKTLAAQQAHPGGRAENMAWVPGGRFLMGSEDFYPEERPVRRVEVDGFWMDIHPVTVADFRRFVAATGYVTLAERPPDPSRYPGADPALLHPGSLVFDPPSGPVDLRDPTQWWRYLPGASWRHPRGPDSTLDGLERHPVTHVAAEDADAYAAWAGKDLPTEAEWELAARGGLEGAVFSWGNSAAPRGRVMANTWHGQFPWQNLKPRRRQGTSPVGSYPPNGFGLYDMAGNVWEWTSDYFAAGPGRRAHRACCTPRNPRVTSAQDSLVAGEPGADIPRRVIKGGSHLCAPNYCLRYRPAARQGEAVDTSTVHLGFRCIVRDEADPS